MYDPTDVNAELNRKVLYSIEQLIEKVKNNKIPESAFFTSIESLWNAVAGLLSDEVQGVLDTLLNQKDKKEIMVSIWEKYGNTEEVVYLEYRKCGNGLHEVSYRAVPRNGYVNSVRKVFQQVGDAVDVYYKYQQQLEKHEYKLVEGQ